MNTRLAIAFSRHTLVALVATPALMRVIRSLMQ